MSGTSSRAVVLDDIAGSVVKRFPHEGAALVLARPFGDLLDKPIAEGGVHFSRFYASGILAAVIRGCILLIRQRAARRAPSAQRRGVPASVL
jgi:uncharacterized membrane-anchored protein